MLHEAERYEPNQPLVTAVVAAFNEERHIETCLRGLLNQSGLDGEVEIIVVDGASTDDTVKIVQSLPEFGKRVLLVSNPQRLQVFAWNLGLRAARGRYFVTISAHTQYSDTYLANCIEVIRSTGASCVGGVQVPIGDGPIGEAIAWAMQSPFAVGNAKFRYAKQEQVVDSVFGAFFEKRTVEELGGFDETNFFDEDDELSYRVRKSGGTIVVSPKIELKYNVRSSLKSLWKQMYRYGFWRRRTQLQHPESIPWRVFAPPIFLIALLVSLGLLIAGRMVGLVVPAAYLLYSLISACISLGSTHKFKTALTVPAVLTVMHTAYGVGWWVGFFRHRRKHSG
jgi:succinoglycan biosynthesis protein ExoA